MPRGNFAGPDASNGSHVQKILEWWESPIGPRDLNKLLLIREMSAMLDFLYRLPGPQFSQVLYALNVPPEVLPGSTAPQREQAFALVRWAFTSQRQSDLAVVLNQLSQ